MPRHTALSGISLAQFGAGTQPGGSPCEVKPRRVVSLPPLKAVLYVLLLAGASLVSTGAWAGEADADGEALVDGFESYPARAWPEGNRNASWYVEYNGYGSSGIVASDGRKYHYQKPKASTAPDETHANMVVSNTTFTGVDMTVQQKTVKQLRTGSRPNPWEVAWLVWGHSDDLHFYYFVFKPNGIELGKVHPGYPGAQRYLYTATSPRMTIGKWYTVRVRQVGATMDVWVDGVQVVKGLVDSPGPAGDEPYTTGSIGMYNEDAYVLFDNVRASSTGVSTP